MSKRQCVVCDADIGHRHWKAKVCSDLCSKERAHRYAEENQKRIAECGRAYRQRKREELLSDRRARFGQ
jgi:hypothetical protein